MIIGEPVKAPNFRMCDELVYEDLDTHQFYFLCEDYSGMGPYASEHEAQIECALYIHFNLAPRHQNSEQWTTYFLRGMYGRIRSNQNRTTA